MPRRPGDVACYYADPSRAAALLAWRAQRDLDAICADAWRWQQAGGATEVDPALPLSGRSVRPRGSAAFAAEPHPRSFARRRIAPCTARPSGCSRWRCADELVGGGDAARGLELAREVVARLAPGTGCRRGRSGTAMMRRTRADGRSRPVRRAQGRRGRHAPARGTSTATRGERRRARVQVRLQPECDARVRLEAGPCRKDGASSFLVSEARCRRRRPGERRHLQRLGADLLGQPRLERRERGRRLDRVVARMRRAAPARRP